MKLEINNDEALVLFELLSRYSDTDVLVVEDQAESRVLWNLTCALEKSLAEPFAENYQQLLSTAQDRVRDEGGMNSVKEKEKGRVALWLDQDQIKLIIEQWRSLPEKTSESVLEKWGDISFRCNTALHKAGLKGEFE